MKSAAQPLCRFCGRKIAKRTTTVWVPHDQRETILTIADAQRLSNLQVVSISRTDSDAFKRMRREVGRRGEPLPKSPIRKFSTWDGESYVDKFFCNGDHARRFAYAAVQWDDGRLAMPAYREAVKAQRATP